jgi:CO/xanthine dehydrogenase Mo-binding subunit
MGLTRDGIILASQIRIVYDGGAYGMSTEGVIRKGAILGGGPYNIPNFQIDTYGVYTNNTPSGAFRSFGSLQSQFATESHLDICAERLGMDPFELRLKNAMRKGDKTHTKQPLNSSSMSDVLEAARTASRWENGVPNMRGATRSDLGGDGTRPSCTLVPRDLINPAADLSNRKGAA